MRHKSKTNLVQWNKKKSTTAVISSERRQNRLLLTNFNLLFICVQIWQICYCKCCCYLVLHENHEPAFSLIYWEVGNSITLETLVLPILLCAHMPPNTTKVTIFSQQWLCCGGKRRPNKAAKIDVNALNVLSNILPCFIESCNEQELNNFADNMDHSPCFQTIESSMWFNAKICHWKKDISRWF